MGCSILSLVLLLGSILAIDGAALTDHVNCDVTRLDDVPVQQDFDVDRFAGIWYVHATTTFIYGDKTRESAIRKIDHNSETSSINIQYTGYDAKLEECVHGAAPGTSEYIEPGSYRYPQRGVTTKYVYTDYQYAIAFVCFNLNNNEYCEDSEKQVEVWSKSNETIPLVKFDYLKKKGRDILCIQPEDLKETELGLCPLSIFDPTDTEVDATNSCQSSPCLHEGVCVDLDNGHRCECLEGFSGVNCEINVDECADGPCQNGGECIDLINDFRCVCELGFTGELCEAEVLGDIFESVRSDDAPAPVENLQVEVLSSKSVSVSWNPPQDSGLPITKYRIIYQIPGQSVETLVDTAETEYILTGLRKFTVYTIRVVAYNSNGRGQYTPDVIVRTHSDVPSGPPQNVLLQALSTSSFRVTWDPPLLGEQNGHITQYLLVIRKRGTCTAPVPVDGGQRSYVFSDLEENTSYAVTVLPVNKNGNGPGSQWKQIKTFSEDTCSYTLYSNTELGSRSGQPIMLSTSNTWTADECIIVCERDQGTASVCVGVLYEPDNGGSCTLYTNDSLPDDVVQNPAAGKDYYKRNCSVQGSLHDASVIYTVPGPPQNFQATAQSSTSISLSWERPPNVSSVTGYKLIYTCSLEGETAVSHVETTNTEYTISGLHKYMEYTVRVMAINGNGKGVEAPPVNVRTLSDLPGYPPQNVAATNITSSSLVISWEPPPLDERNGVILGYRVVYRKSRACGTTELVSGSQHSFLASGLDADTIYEILMIAYTRHGRGPTTPYVRARTLQEDDECHIDAVPPQENFHQEQFLGIWYTVYKTTNAWSSPWTSDIHKFVVDEDGSVSMLYTAYTEETCTPVTIYKFTDFGQGSANFLYDSKTGTFKVLHTDYRYAVTDLCFDVLDDGSCAPDKHQIEILSQDNAPEWTEDIQNSLFTWIQTHLCVESSELIFVKEGNCEIPEVLKQVLSDQGSQTETAESDVTCTLDDLPVQKNFQLEQMAGLWYEIARTRLTFNQMESCIHYFDYHSGTEIYSQYAGTRDGECSSALSSTSRYRGPDYPAGDLESKIGDKESMFPWIPMKMIYVDDNYMMYYACYESKDNICLQNKQEVTLVGRTRDIDLDTRQQITSLLSDYCINPDELVDTEFEANCTSFIHRESEDNEEPEERCLLDSIPVKQDFDVNQFVGDWHIIARQKSKNPTENRPQFKIVRFIRRHGNGMRIQLKENYGDGVTVSSLLQPRCTSSTNAEFISSYNPSPARQWATVKILYTDYHNAVIYMCAKPQENGACSSDSTSVILLSRSCSLSEERRAELNDVVKHACVDPVESLINITDHVVDLDTSTPDPETVSDCSIERFPLQPNFNFSKISGYWYEVAQNHNPMFQWNSGLVYYEKETYRIGYVGARDDGTCMGPLTGQLKPRCPGTLSADFVGKLQLPGITKYAPWKVLYTDYDTVLVPYSCMAAQPDGSCAPSAQRLHILAREKTISADVRARVNEIISQACIDPTTLLDVNHPEDCRANIEQAFHLTG